MTPRFLVLVPALVLAGCGPPAAHPAPGPRAACVAVVNASARPLPVPRPGIIEAVARHLADEPRPEFSAVDAFAAAASDALRARGVRVVEGARSPGVPLLRVTLLDLEIRNHDVAGAVAFLSAQYRLLDTDDAALWSADQKREPIRLGGPDLTHSELQRLAAEAVRRAFSSFPDGPHAD